MYTLYVGLGLMALGLVFFVAARISKNQSTAQASNGSVAVGRDNSGPITNISVGKGEKAHHGGHGLTIAAIIVELAGIGVTLWHAYHMAAK